MFSPRTDNGRNVPKIELHTSLEEDFAQLLKDSEENQIFEFHMSKVTDVWDEDDSSKSAKVIGLTTSPDAFMDSVASVRGHLDPNILYS